MSVVAVDFQQTCRFQQVVPLLLQSQALLLEPLNDGIQPFRGACYRLDGLHPDAAQLAVDLLDLRKQPVDLLPVAQALFLCRLSAAGQHRCRFVIYLFWKTHNNPLPVLAPCHLYRLPSSPMNQPSCG